MLTGWCIKSRTVLCKSFRVADTTATSRAVAALASGKAAWQNLTPAFYQEQKQARRCASCGDGDTVLQTDRSKPRRNYRRHGATLMSDGLYAPNEADRGDDVELGICCVDVLFVKVAARVTFSLAVAKER